VHPRGYAEQAVLLGFTLALATQWPELLPLALVIAGGMVWSDTRLVVAAGRLYFRNAFRWRRPVDLTRLASVRYGRGGGGNTGDPLEPEIGVVDSERRNGTVGLWYWRDACAFARALQGLADGQPYDAKSAAALDRLRRRCEGASR
jgi:hypothetical protein